MSRGRTERLLVRGIGEGRGGRVPDEVLVEEPLEIRVHDVVVATTMRTPGHDVELACGFLWAEGQLGAAPAEVRYCATGSASDTEFNVVSVAPAVAVRKGPAAPRARLGLTSSSCGICGAEQIEALVERLDPVVEHTSMDPSALLDRATAVAAHQELFGRTGGSHAAAVLDARGDLLVVREDIGRHNAVDKTVGRLLLDGSLPALDPSGGVVSGRGVSEDGESPDLVARPAMTLWVSGRASFEIVQKAWAAGFVAVVAVGAVSALAVHTARRAGIVLVGFSRDRRGTVYAGEDKLEAMDDERRD